jgi:hypothetical protein
MEETTRVNGSITIWTALAAISGVMGDPLKGSIQKTRSMDLVYIIGQMVEST